MRPKGGKNVLVVLTHKTTDAFEARMQMTRLVWESLHHGNELVILVDTSDTIDVQRRLEAAGLRTIGIRKDAVEAEVAVSTERDNIRFRGFDMVFHYTRRHFASDFVWYLENDVKYDEQTLRKLWELHSRDATDVLAWDFGKRAVNWWAWKRAPEVFKRKHWYTIGILVMACRMSRRVLDAVNESLLAGSAAYVEILIGSIAKQHGYTLKEWHASLVGELIPGPDINGANVKMLGGKNDCRRPADATDCGGQLWHPSILLQHP